MDSDHGRSSGDGWTRSAARAVCCLHIRQDVKSGTIRKNGRPSRRATAPEARRPFLFSFFAIPSEPFLLLYCVARTRARSKIWHELFHVKHARASAHARGADDQQMARSPERGRKLRAHDQTRANSRRAARICKAPTSTRANPRSPLNAKNVLFYYIVCGGPERNSTLQLQRNSIRKNIREYRRISANIREKLKEKPLPDQWPNSSSIRAPEQ